MKSTVVPWQTRVQCGRVVCRNGLTIRIADYPYDLTMSNGTVYLAGAGFEHSGLVAETSFSPSVVDLEGFVGQAGVTRDLIRSGVFDGALSYYFFADFTAPVEDAQPFIKTVFGKTTISDDRYRIEQMALPDYLGQDLSETITAACPKAFGGQAFGGCGVNLAAITVTGTLSAVTSSLVVVDSARAEAADRFGWGTMAFTSGSNAGLAPIKIRDFAAGVFTLYEPPYYPVTPGTSYTATPGCRGTRAACQGHGNMARFGGFEFVPLASTTRSVGGSNR